MSVAEAQETREAQQATSQNVAPDALSRGGGSPGSPAPHTDQRAALRDLVSLATESAATETRIDREYEDALKQAQQTSEKTKWAIAQRYESLRATIRDTHEQKLAEADRRHRSERAALQASDAAAREQSLAEYVEVGRVVRDRTEQAVWMADSLLEVALNQLQDQAKKLKEAVTAQTSALDKIDYEARGRALRYGYDPDASEIHAVQPPTVTSPEEAAAAFATHRDEAAERARHLHTLKVPELLVGVTPWLVVLVVTGVAGGVAWWATGGTGAAGPNWIAVGAAAAGALLLTLLAGLLLRNVARRQAREAYLAVAQALAEARAAVEAQVQAADRIREREEAKSRHKRDTEARYATDHFAPGLANAEKKRNATVQALDARLKDETARIEAQLTSDREAAEAWRTRTAAQAEQQHALESQGAQLQFDRETQAAHNRYHQAREALERRLREGLATLTAPIGASNGSAVSSPLLWEDPAWNTWTPPQRFATAVRFGELTVDLRRIAESAPAPVDPASQPQQQEADPDEDGEEGGNGELREQAPAPVIGHVRLELPPPFVVPATLGFPRHASLLIEADREGRAAAIRAVQTVMTRLLTTLPAGRVRFTLLDPVGLGQNFAGFMHLADHDEALVGGRIWTEADQIDQRLTNLTGHMETVIQKYLRNEFDTIDDYNAQAGELAEPYRFLVISDFPAGFSDEALRRLSSVASTGARCGVYTLIFRDTRLPLPMSSGTVLDDLRAHSITIAQESSAAETFAWDDPVYRQFPLRLDPPPTEESLTKILDKVGRAAKDANRVEVPFETISPKPEQFWTRSAQDDLRVPIGRLGATRLQEMRLGRGVAQHVLIAGKTGSGKSTLLHALVTNLAMWYSPDEVEFYLIDFKKGVEFKTYATHTLPHARAIAVESDREFGLSVLQRLDAELGRRGELFRRAGVQDLASYRQTPGAVKVPRTLLIVDEFQEFFSEDDKLAQDASVLLDRLVRQGRAFGVHVLLGSQTIAGSGGLPRSTIGQMAVRVALQTSEADSQLILGDNNSAARLLSRPGEAIYNDQGGLVEGNSPFQVAWLPDEQRERYLERVRQRADAGGDGAAGFGDPVVFEGNAPADVRKNRRLAELLAAPTWPEATTTPKAYVGEPVAIKDPTAVTLRRQSGANLMLIGQQEEAAMSILVSSLISLAAQHRPGAAKFYVLDATPADSALAGTFERVRPVVPHDVRLVEWRAVPEAINELAGELQSRREGEHTAAEAVYVLIYGLQRYRVLRKSEDDFNFSMGSAGGGDEEKKADPGKQFADLLREGPAVGMHVLAWADTPVAVERTLERTALREFDHRILFQMSANDSSNLIDSPAANKLGFYRALYFSEEQGLLEKFRPYALPTAAWLEEVKAQFARKGGG